jgi:glycosyltransferase involved in cell wall biosynthesis
MFGWEFPPHLSGGLGTACFGLTKGLAHHNVDITFVLPRLHGNVPHSHVKLLGASRVRVHVGKRKIKAFKERVKLLEIDSPIMPYLSGDEYQLLMASLKRQEKVRQIEDLEDQLLPELDNYGCNLMSEIVKYSLIAGTIARNRNFDVIHAHDWMTFLAGMEAKKNSGKPLVVHVHSIESDRSGEQVNKGIFDIERAGMLAADLIIAVSHYTKDNIVKRYGIPESKIRVVHNAVSKEKRFSEFRIKKRVFKEKIVLFLGRITYQKGPEYFVQAARKVVDRVENVRFVMAGAGDMFPRMVDQVAILRLGEYFHFTGFLRGADVEKMYAMSDVYVMPSVSEPFGITPLEAMVHNVPVIVSKQSGIAEILDHAIKVDFWDVDALADGIVRILTDQGFARRMAKESGRQLNGIKWELAAEKVLSVYNELA